MVFFLRHSKEPPRLRPARVIGYEIRLWGPYPALIDGPPSHAVEGVACEILSQKHLDRLIAYETEKYYVHACEIDLLDVGVGREETVDGNVFMWDGELDELQEGDFNLKVTCEKKSWGRCRLEDKVRAFYLSRNLKEPKCIALVSSFFGLLSLSSPSNSLPSNPLTYL